MKRAASAKSKRDSLMVVQLQVRLRENLAADYEFWMDSPMVIRLQISPRGNLAADYESNIQSLLNIAGKSI